ncbi:MAG TPA: zinc-binding dehydrogenase [Bacillota bacterium]|mgnify:CR=1 FL=1|nr:zinc-binding dehydrogenase [Bacillota bacterium]
MSTLNAKAMVMEEFNAPLQLREVSMEMPRDVIVVEILAAGICGSDIHMWRANDPRVSLPLVLGHEAVGRIISLPCEKHDLYGVKLVEGDLVIWNRGMTCGRCQACVLWKQPALCSQRWTYGINPPAEFGLLQGGYATHILLRPETDFLKLSEADDLTAMVIASCSGATAAHALDLISIRQDETVLVQGSGPLGLFAVALAKSRGARVHIIGSGEERLKLAKELGAEEVWDRRATTVEERREAILKGNAGVDAVVEAAGSPAAVEEGLELLRPGGSYLVAGFGDPAGTFELDPYRLARRQIRLQGVWTSDARHLAHAVAVVKKQPEVIKRIGTEYPLEAANEALLAMENRQIIKAVLKPQ